MSDYIYSTNQAAGKEIRDALESCRSVHQPRAVVREFDGKWGSLAVSEGLYQGFSPFEDAQTICVVIGGPVLCFRNNRFLTDHDPTAGTVAILERWRSGTIDWSEDLSGPFAIMIIEKGISKVFCVTDLMMFIPVYAGCRDNNYILGTHLDMVAKASGNWTRIDNVSAADFILHGVVTHPNTMYPKVNQLRPAAVHEYHNDACAFKGAPSLIKSYWRPLEGTAFSNIDEAAECIRNGISDYIHAVTEGMTEVAHFLSAGEDSRAICGLIPECLERHAFVFLDTMNREGVIARRVAKIYGCNFHYVSRKPTFYLDILPEASQLVGAGQEYRHAHSAGLSREAELHRQTAVLGGFLSDTLLKGLHVRQPAVFRVIPMLPEFSLMRESRSSPVVSSVFSHETLSMLTRRRRRHVERVRKYRPKTVHEWFSLWPIGMYEASPYFSSNRRLFPTYEPFTAKEVVKTAAAVPTSWKLNRRLFHRAMQPALRKSRHVPHGEGFYPYYPWQANLPIRTYFKALKLIKLFFPHGKNEGPWADWNKLSRSDLWDDWERRLNRKILNSNIVRHNVSEDLVKILPIDVKLNFFQVAALLERMENEGGTHD